MLWMCARVSDDDRNGSVRSVSPSFHITCHSPSPVSGGCTDSQPASDTCGLEPGRRELRSVRPIRSFTPPRDADGSRLAPRLFPADARLCADGVRRFRPPWR